MSPQCPSPGLLSPPSLPLPSQPSLIPSLRPAGQEPEVGTRGWKKEADSWASKRQVGKRPPTPVQSPQPSRPVSPPVPVSVRCPVCLSPASCRSAREETCPAGTTHPCSRELVFIGGGIGTSVSIQGCVPEEGCNLFKGTQHIGPLVMTENCLPRGLLTCHRGNMQWTHHNLSHEPVTWPRRGNRPVILRRCVGRRSCS